MNETNPQKPKIIVDDDWKTRVQAEKEQLRRAEETKGPQAVAEKPQARTDQPLPPASFSTLVTSLATQALIMLGQIADPEGTAILELGQAKHLIDTLGMLQEKTAGNLTPDEAMLLENVLHELRMIYVAMSKRQA